MTRVLIADDQPGIRQLLRFILTAAGHQVIEAVNGTEAIALAAENRPVIAILDVAMPGRSGLEVCQAIRSDPSLARTRVIMVTANGLPTDARAAFAAGADHFLRKPFSPARLQAMVAELGSGNPV